MTTILAIIAALIIDAAHVAIVVLVTGQRNDAWAESERLERELEARAPGVTMVPRVTFVAPVVAAAVERPDLHIVPPQRDGEHDRLPVADGSFPVHTAVDEDELTALVRATEEKA